MNKFYEIFRFLLFATLTFSFADFEDCVEILQSDNLTESLSSRAKDISISYNDENVPSTEKTLKLILENNTNYAFIREVHEGSQTIPYDGFFCLKDATTSRNPCKQYLHYTESHSDNLKDSMLCFKKMSVSQVEVIIILNRKPKSNIFKYLAESDSHLQNARFIYSTLKFVSESIKSVSPVLAFKDNSHHWLMESNLIAEMTLDGHLYVRYRFIDTSAPSRLADVTKKQIIEQAFYFVKRFYYGNQNCKKVVLDGHSNGYLKALEGQKSFPRGFRNTYDFLVNNDKVRKRTTVSERSIHVALMKMVAISYCRGKVSYDIDTLNALLQMIALLFEEDQYFKTDEAKNAFIESFQEIESYSKISTEDIIKTVRSVSIDEEYEALKLLIDDVQDEPVFQNAGAIKQTQIIRLFLLLIKNGFNKKYQVAKI
jgi:hypothetical protein